MSEHIKVKYVAHILTEYLPHTTNWIYTQLKFSKIYKSYVLTEKLINHDFYAHERIYVSGSIYKILNRIILRLGFLPPNKYLYFSKILKKYKPICIFAHFGWEGYFSLGLKKKLNIPLITRFYGYDIGILPHIPMWRRRYKKLFLNGDLFIAEGVNMRNLLIQLGCDPEKIFIHHLGVDLENIPFKQGDFNPKIFKILIAATFKEKKGLEYAIEAIAEARKILLDIDIRVRVIGDGPLNQKLRGLSEILGLSDLIEWSGYQDHEQFIDALYQADVFLSPSVTASDGDTEGGAPVAIIEASASGLPVLSTQHADIPEVVINGVSGILVPERDTSSLASAIVFLAHNPEIRYEYGLAGHRHVSKNYDATIQGKKLEMIYSRFDKNIN